MKQLAILTALVGLSLYCGGPVLTPLDGEEPSRAGVPKPATAAPAATPAADAVEKRRAVIRREYVAPLAIAEAARKVNTANLERHLRLVLNAEIYFVIHTCDLTDEQARSFKSAAEQCLQPTLEQVATRIRGMSTSRKGILLVLDGGDRQWVRSESLIHAEILKIARDKLTPQQSARYADELAQRTASRKRATVAMLLSRLDEILTLNADQRKALSETLAANWQATWETNGWRAVPSQLPQIPDAALVSILDGDQMKICRGIQISGASTRSDKAFLALGGALEELSWDETEPAPEPDPSQK